MNQENFNWDIPISYAPNTMQIPIGDTVIVRNIDGQGSDWHVLNVEISNQTLVVKEKMLAILN